MATIARLDRFQARSIGETSDYKTAKGRMPNTNPTQYMRWKSSSKRPTGSDSSALRRRRLWLNALAVPVLILVGRSLFLRDGRDAAAQTQSGRVVADAKYTSPYDAFMKMNRLREGFAKNEDASDYWGFMESRLGNQAGRILIKRPAKGFNDDAFRGWLIFIRSYGNSMGIGNCTACHTVPDFTDRAKHQIGTTKQPIDTPALRDLGKKRSYFQDGSAKTLEAAITRHVENARIAQQNKRAGVEVEVGKIALTEEEVHQVAEFLRSLNSVERDSFREYLVDVEIQPVEIDFSD